MKNLNWETQKKYKDIIKDLTKIRNKVPVAVHKAAVDDLIAQFEMVVESIKSGPSVFGKIFAGHVGYRP